MVAARAVNELKYTEFRATCDAGAVGACTSLGEWHELLRGDAAAAIALYRPACLEKRYAQACLNLGNALGAWGLGGRGGYEAGASGGVRAPRRRAWRRRWASEEPSDGYAIRVGVSPQRW